jgi:hypothetical protein
MKFQDKFKPGDIICSDHFHNGLCMVVGYGGTSLGGEFRYSCVDLVREEQGWVAYGNGKHITKPYSWRIATDDDIANYLSRFLYIPLGKVGPYEVTLTDKGICFDNGFDFNIYFEAEELVQLGKIINERVVG